MPYKDPEKRKACFKKWAAEHKDKMLEYRRKWRKKHPESDIKVGLRQRALYPEKYAVRRHTRRASRSNTLYLLTPEQEKEILKTGCLFCGSDKNLTVAHDTPVIKGGATTRGNCFCLCKSCNSKMNTKTLAQTIKQLSF